MKILSLLAFALASTAAFASDLDFVLVNKTDRSFEGLYVSPGAAKKWGSNLFSEGVVWKKGKTVKVTFPAGEDLSKWDLNVVDDIGLAVNFDDVDLAGADKVILTEKDGKISATVE